MKNISLNKGRRVWYFTICCCLYFTVSFAEVSKKEDSGDPSFVGMTSQQQQITGTVTDKGNPLPGVTVHLKRNNTTVLTDFDGQYSINALPTDVLVFSFIGYKTIAVAVNNQTILNIQLQETATNLQEVKVNAGYYSVKESERTGSIARITAAAIETQPVTNVLAVMQGRMAGVNVTQTSGVPGGGFDIQIRGQNSLRTQGNAPLYVIDGVPYSSESIGYNQTSVGTPSTTSPLNSIDPASIESIEVLKDADATAIYGSRGANGVVLITTKKGKEGKTTVTINSSTGKGSATKFIDLMNTKQYLAMRRQAFTNDGITPYPYDAYDVDGTWDQNRNTNWQKELLGGTALITGIQATVSGGSSLTQFLLSGNYRNETTVFAGDFRYKKGGLHFSMNHQSEDKKLKVSFSAGYISQNNIQPGFDLTRIAATISPNAPALYDAEGNLNWENGTFQNPLSNLDIQFKSVTADLVGNGVLSYEFFPGFQMKSSFGFTDLRNDETRAVPSTIYNPAYGIGPEYSSLFTNDTARHSWIIEPQLQWHKDFGTDKLEVLVGSTMQNQKSDVLYQAGFGFSSNSLIHDFSSSTYKAVYNSSETLYKYLAFFARVNYNINSRYILNVTGRRDGSSRFGPENSFANFGAVGAAWVFSDEPLIKDKVSVLSFGKLRTSYGITGNDQIGDYQFLDTYSSSGTNYHGIIGLQPTRLYNPNFGWEKNKKLEVALEIGLLKDRIFFTAAGYQNLSSNQLVGIPLPGTTGFASLNANLNATVENKGYEFTLRTQNIQDSHFSWITNFNISTSRNKLLSFPDLSTSSYSETYVIGHSLNIQKAYHFTGLNPQTGVYEFEDVNGDGVISAPDDKQTVLDFSPRYFGGLQNQFSYYGWQLDFLFQFVKQQNWDYAAGYAGGMYNQPAAIANSWQQSGDTTAFQQFTSGTNGEIVQAYSNYTLSDAGVVDASYIRLKNIALSYALPQHWSKSVHCKISLQGQNILTFTNYKNGDPEFRNPGYLPPLKTYNLGVQLTF
ncbi:TonB-linked outer membrane protein, SusC/RagA family [Flavobacterium gillisiae]|uniref:TonB-linked outer membrane protein, SusC/RagA family n=1 Tax=Flavobacterium gillisiae TaxID=150146 RepID=A0A1H3ZP33_9FLAO|nr:SusC/RagA family TonB-linked outer membrane protein [Flavobacterium gillisiae]SEA25539.1 TonB-linked outer membrane protein, SusC/RagA family [Flavobacterium gillisiae]